MSGTTICAAQSVVIGDYTRIGANVTIADTDFHSLDPSKRRDNDEANYAKVAPIVIGHDVFIGASSFILKGVRVGDYAVVGAGSVVTKDVPDYAVVAGNPSVIVGDARKYIS
jgi:acetyltransferase-like isoleucine patch superfamily enzyme